MFDREILPGGEGRIEVRLPAAELRVGRASANVEILSDDPRGSDFVVLSGEISAGGELAANAR